MKVYVAVITNVITGNKELEVFGTRDLAETWLTNHKVEKCSALVDVTSAGDYIAIYNAQIYVKELNE